MKGIKNIITKFDTKQLKYYFILSLLIIVAIIILSTLKITEAKYESETVAEATPNFAFFIVDVGTQTQSMRLDDLVPSNTAQTYTFDVSNFQGDRKANVDLTYSIEIITTTNLPLEYKLYKGSSASGSENFTESLTTNSDGVYFRHYLYNDASTMSFEDEVTDHYTLWIKFPATDAIMANNYDGTIELIDIEIKAEQVVDE